MAHGHGACTCSGLGGGGAICFLEHELLGLSDRRLPREIACTCVCVVGVDVANIRRKSSVRAKKLSKQAEREVGLRPLKEFADFLVSSSVVERTMRDNQYVLQAKNMLWNDWYRQRISR